MCELTRESVSFEWTELCDESLQTLKQSHTNDSAMAYFDPHLETELVVDASPCGLGAMLVQYTKSKPDDNRIVSYASCTLDSVQTGYSQTEREALAIKWAVEHFHLYLFGIKFTVVTDHKPLVSIFKTPLLDPLLESKNGVSTYKVMSFQLCTDKESITQLIT